MNIIDKFGNIVGTEAMKDPEKARRLLLTGYRMQEKKLQLFPDRALPESGQYVAKIVMKNIIEALAKPEQAAMAFICKRLKLNYGKLSEEERKWLKRIAQKSDLLKNPNPQRGRK